MWRTDSLSMAAFLYSCGVEHVKFERRGAKAFWCFERTPRLKECVQEYVMRDARVEPVKFNECLQRARTALFDFLDAA